MQTRDSPTVLSRTATEQQNTPLLVPGPVNMSRGRRDFAGGIKLRPLRWGLPWIPQGSQYHHRILMRGSACQKQRDRRCFAVGYEDGGRDHKPRTWCL